jgi:glycosyltransferase involved in cell wall biosynthesis
MEIPVTVQAPVSPPKITLIIAVRNMKDGLSRAIDSVIQQNYSNLELIVFDGESTDGTLDVIKKYERYITKWQSGKDLGHCDACNKALAFATGDLIALLNADDELVAGALAEIALVYQQHPNVDVISCGVTIMNNNVAVHYTDEKILALSLYNVLFNLPLINARFINKNVFQRLGNFNAVFIDGGYYVSNDRFYMSRLALHSVTTATIPKALYIYHAHQESLTFSKKHVLRTNEEHIWLAQNLLKEYQLDEQNHRIITKWLAKETGYRFCRLLAMGQIKEAFAIAKLGLAKCKLLWPQQLVLTLWRGVRKVLLPQ